jgi:hypothetical protein
MAVVQTVDEIEYPESDDGYQTIPEHREQTKRNQQ